MPKVIAETDELLVLDKPAGLIVHSDGRTEEPSVADWILQNFPALSDVGESWVSPQGNAYPAPGIVHRLDRSTSGVMLVAKTPAMYAFLKQAFKERRVEKTYRAYVHGQMAGEEGRIVAEIKRTSEAPRKWYAEECDESNKRAAITDWRVLARLGEATYVEVMPRTGRTHQIRVHLAFILHPLVGDHLYASVLQKTAIDGDTDLAFTRPALHACSISLELPSGERVLYEAPLPLDFRAWDISPIWPS